MLGGGSVLGCGGTGAGRIGFVAGRGVTLGCGCNTGLAGAAAAGGTGAADGGCLVSCGGTGAGLSVVAVGADRAGVTAGLGVRLRTMTTGRSLGVLFLAAMGLSFLFVLRRARHYSYGTPGVDTIQKISIIPRGVAALGYTLQLPTEDRFLMTKSELENKIAVLLGGRVAEELVYREASTGAHDDLLKTTEIARSMVKDYGMSQKLGQLSFGGDRRPLFLQAPQSYAPKEYSEATAQDIDAEVRQIVETQFARVTTILTARQRVLRAAAGVLLRKETITGEELQAIASRTKAPLIPDGANATTIH